MIRISTIVQIAVVVTAMMLSGCTWIRTKDVPSHISQEGTADMSGVPTSVLAPAEPATAARQ